MCDAYTPWHHCRLCIYLETRDWWRCFIARDSYNWGRWMIRVGLGGVGLGLYYRSGRYRCWFVSWLSWREGYGFPVGGQKAQWNVIEMNDATHKCTSC